MPPKTLQHTRECRDDLIETFRNRILEVAVPRVTYITGRQEVVPPRRKFYPVEELKEIFTISNVRRILSHECTDCSQHLPANHPVHPSQHAEKVLRTDASLNLFALLVWLRHPLLIGIFITGYDTSLPLPRYFSLYDLNDRQFKHLPSRSREQLASAFQDHKWQFSVPELTDGMFQSYQAGTILPFLDEEPIGRGGYGKVFKVWVHQSYCTLNPVQIAGSASRNPGAKVFARKEIVDDDAVEFIKEKTSLERIATLRDPHLVQIEKTYQLGDKFNILFPWAKTNLFMYLRNRAWRAPQQARIGKNPLWEQVLGITRALSKIINFTDPDEPEKIIFGYHCDLKPQNILVDNSATGSRDVFKITDFGQAMFLTPGIAGTTDVRSIIHVKGGTDAYAPPEYLDNEQDRVYDVWSLAIIVLEVLAYAIRGVEGLLHPENGLDNVRTTKEGRQTNARFYTCVDSRAKVKPIIHQWMEDLVKDASVRDHENQQFVQRLVRLIIRMLEPQMKKRIGIDAVVAEMSEIFQMKASEVIEVPAESLKAKDEVVLVDLKTVDYYPHGVQGRQSSRVPFVILESDKNVLRTFIDRPLAPLKDHRKQMKLVLAFQHNEDIENDTYEIAFAPMRDDSPVSLEGQSIAVNDRTIARRLQTALTGHHVSESYHLEEMVLKEYTPPLKEAASKFKAMASRGFRKSKYRDDPSNGVFIPLWIELWIEKPQAKPQTVTPMSPTTESPPSPRRANRQTRPGKKVPLGRVVVYFKDRILVLPFEQECKLAKQDNMERLQEQNIVFEPMDRRQCEFFYASWLLPSEGELPGIPMQHQNLYEVEEETSFKCDSVTLKFEKPSDARAFYKLYKNEKALWLDGKKGKPAAHKSLMPVC